MIRVWAFSRSAGIDGDCADPALVVVAGVAPTACALRDFVRALPIDPENEEEKEGNNATGELRALGSGCARSNGSVIGGKQPECRGTPETTRYVLAI